MSSILPIISISELTRTPYKAFSKDSPYTVVRSHKEDKGVILQPEIFKKVINTKVWQEICEEWWEAHDEDTQKVLKKGKNMIKKGNYKNATPFV